MNEVGLKILRLFDAWERDSLDLHEMFEAGDSNDPGVRTAILHTVEDLVADGLLEERGNDFYALTAEGRSLSLHNLGGSES